MLPENRVPFGFWEKQRRNWTSDHEHDRNDHERFRQNYKESGINYSWEGQQRSHRAPSSKADMQLEALMPLLGLLASNNFRELINALISSNSKPFKKP